jgi:acylglycerol lipase
MAEEERMVRRRASALFAAARAALVTGLMALAACAPVLSPRGAENIAPAIEQGVFLTRDGLRLPLRHWGAEHPRAIIVALHGMSDYSEAFDLPGAWWAVRGITTYAYDQRGFGRSPNAGLWAGSDAMRQDLADFVEATRAKYPGMPVYALGESMGGSVVLTALASDRPPRVDGAILVSPAVWSRADMPISYRAALWIAARFVPGMHVSGRGLHIVACDNIEVLRKLSRDPVYQHSVRADQVYGLVNLMDEAREAGAHLVHPPRILLLYGGNDQVIPKAPTKAVIAALGQRADVRFYPHGYHMLLRDLDGERRWADIADWTRPYAFGAADRALLTWCDPQQKRQLNAPNGNGSGAKTFSLRTVENVMHETKHDTSGKKPDLRDKPAASLRDTNVESPAQDPQHENSSDPRRPRSGPDIVKPGVGGQATGQTSRQ